MNPRSISMETDYKGRSEHAFIELWEFIESQGLDLMTENDMKCALVVLGEAAQVPDHLVHGLPGGEIDLEAMFYIRNKSGDGGNGNV